MASFMEQVFEKAKKDPKKVVLPEGNDERTVEAAAKCAEMKIADITILGNPDKIKEIAKNKNLKLDGVKILDLANLPDIKEYANEFYEMRKAKGVTPEQAMEIMKKDVYYGAMMVKKGVVDKFVAGAVNTTSDVSRAAIYLIGMKPGIKTLSSFFIMILPDKSFGKDGVLFYSDGGFVIDPDENQLSDIAVTTGNTYRELMGEEPKVAMLSFSTKGSAKHARIDKVIKAMELAKQKDPSMMIDGEMQGDAALIPAVGAKKAPGSSVAGQANVLIFPDLDSGNIAYKLTERLAKAEAYGPIYQGTARPCSDLSRGCKASDIINVTAINVVRLQNHK
ncbi:MAG TPA: phosphate acetyltransferase [Candidatus Goldiibacteriota bacterium]|nr:phosphate acetyltransferase [Candidatus Goldiibacteriota bacterium]